MAYAFVQDVAVSWSRYRSHTTALDDPAPEGLIMHLAGPTDEGFRVIDIWESEHAWARFRGLRTVREADAGDPFEHREPVTRPLHVLHAVLGAMPSS